MSIKLTILVPTVPNRLEVFYLKIMKELIKQTEKYNDIELISFFDNKKRTIGTKRQEMIGLVQGEYIVFIDDDDRISEDYVDKIMEALYNNPHTDCVVFHSITRINGGPEILCKYDVEYEYGYISNTEWRGKPAHTMVYKSEIAKRYKFPNLQNGEDIAWVKNVCKDIKKLTKIEKVLYYYDANYLTTSETAILSDKTIKNNIKILSNKQNFWDEKHKTNDEYWLSKHINAECIFKLHDLKEIVNQKVLDIGIGFGFFANKLSLLNNEVFASDISNYALNRVSSFAKTYNTTELKYIESVDLAICNLVFQYCDDNEIERIINDVNLKQNGIFSFQFAFIRENEKPNERLKSYIWNDTHYFRSLDRILQIIEKSNKKLYYISKPIHYYGEENCSWYIVKVFNK